jgi:hypothetical protein
MKGTNAERHQLPSPGGPGVRLGEGPGVRAAGHGRPSSSQVPPLPGRVCLGGAGEGARG